MKSILLLAILLMPLTSGLAASPNSPLLPAYKKEARIVYQGMCDAGKVAYATYHKRGGYILEVARIPPKGLFYFIKRYAGIEEGWQEHYLMQESESSILKEVSHQEWDETIREISPNYFNKLHDLLTTCSKMLLV